MRERILFVVSGPSGSGKTTLTRRVIEKVGGIRFAVSCTTRDPRPDEVDGVDYRFVSQNEFDSMVAEDEFAEWAVVHGNRYGTPFDELNRAEMSDDDILLDIDSQGARSIKEKYRSGVYVFVTTSSFDDLRDRLVKREGEVANQVKKRLQHARSEVEEIGFYDYIIINNSIEKAVCDFASIIRAERCRRERFLGELERINDPR